MMTILRALFIFVLMQLSNFRLLGGATGSNAIEGIPNWGVVNEYIFRGGQPNAIGYESLKKEGIDIVINLRYENDQVSEEKRLIEEKGMRFVSFPIRAYSAPTDAQVSEFLQVLNDSQGKRIFIHCRRGAERTGVMIACYRVSSGWSAQQAYEEMLKYKFRSFWFRRLKHFLFRFEEQLAAKPAPGLPGGIAQPAEQGGPWPERLAPAKR